MKPPAHAGGGRRMERYRGARRKRTRLRIAGVGRPERPRNPSAYKTPGSIEPPREGARDEATFPGQRQAVLEPPKGTRRFGGPLGRRTRFRERCDRPVRRAKSAGGRGRVSGSRPLGVSGPSVSNVAAQKHCPDRIIRQSSQLKPFCKCNQTLRRVVRGGSAPALRQGSRSALAQPSWVGVERICSYTQFESTQPGGTSCRSRCLPC